MRAKARVLAATVLLVLTVGGALRGLEWAGGASTPRLAVQEAIASRLGIPVILDVQMPRPHQDWVFLAGHPLSADDNPIDYTRTPYAQDQAEGSLDDTFTALVRRQGQEGRGWEVAELSLGAIDAPFIDWFERHGLPLDLASRGDDKD